MKTKIIITLCVCLIGVVILFIFSIQTSVEKLYYISDAKIYIKIKRERSSDTVNIYLTKNEKAHFEGNEDCIKTMQNFPITLILDGSNPNKIILPSYCKDGICKIHRNKFEIVCSKDEYTDTMFYKPMKEYGIHILKDPFLGIAISEYIENVYVVFSGDSFLTKIDEVVK